MARNCACLSSPAGGAEASAAAFTASAVGGSLLFIMEARAASIESFMDENSSIFSGSGGAPTEIPPLAGVGGRGPGGGALDNVGVTREDSSASFVAALLE